MTNKSSVAHVATYTTDMLNCLTLIHQGKVRDSFALDENHMLIVASLSLIHISEPTRPPVASRMPSSA